MALGTAPSTMLMELLAIRLMKLLAIPPSNQKTVAKWLVISPQAGKSPVIRAGILGKLLLWPLLALSFSGHAAGFSLQDIQGRTHHLEDYRGKWVLVNFWATWCPPCLSEIPELTSLHDAHKDSDLVVIGIAIDSGSSRKVADFLRAHGISYPVVMGNRKIAAQIGGLDMLPTSYLYAPNGEQVSRQAGEVTRASVETYIKGKKFD